MSKIYDFTQEVAATTWIVVHNLDGYPVVDAVLSTGEKILPQTVVYVDSNSIEINFSSAQAGTARLAVSI